EHPLVYQGRCRADRDDDGHGGQAEQQGQLGTELEAAEEVHGSTLTEVGENFRLPGSADGMNNSSSRSLRRPLGLGADSMPPGGRLSGSSARWSPIGYYTNGRKSRLSTE